MIESLSGQGINVQQGRPDAPRTLRRIWLAGEIADVHKASGGTYGALRVTAEPRYGREIHVGHNAVESIMLEIGIRGADPQVAARREGVEGDLSGSGGSRLPA